jgi:hypothetical protein
MVEESGESEELEDSERLRCEIVQVSEEPDTLGVIASVGEWTVVENWKN